MVCITYHEIEKDSNSSVDCTKLCTNIPEYFTTTRELEQRLVLVKQMKVSWVNKFVTKHTAVTQL